MPLAGRVGAIRPRRSPLRAGGVGPAGGDACAIAAGSTDEQIWMALIMERSGRQPSFEESNAWRDQMDRRISRYLAEHPEVANSYDVHTFRFDKQVVVGMTK